MINVMDFLQMIFYMVLIIFVITLIILTYRAIQTLKKVDEMVDDFNKKSSKLNGLFNIIDTTTDAVVGVSDTIVSAITNGIEFLFNRKRDKKNE